MKKILSLFIVTVVVAQTSFAQDADKKFRFGLRVAAQPTWLRSDDVKNYANSGTKFGFGFGLNAEFKLTSAVSFSTGIGGDFIGGSQEYKTDNTTLGYAVDKAGSYVEIDKNWAANGSKFYSIQSRKVKTTYVTIPLTLKMMTNEISGLKYFGVFGGNLGILTKARAEDQVTLVSGSLPTAGTNSDMNIYHDCIPVKAELNVGIGTEYRLSGTTSAFLSINYIRGFTNLYRGTSKFLVTDFPNTYVNQISPPMGAKQGALGDMVQINIGILF